jgi:hypothetical protein
MKVRELRKKLKKMDQDLDVKFRTWDRDYGEDFEDVDEVDVHTEHIPLHNPEPPFVVLS